MTAMRILVINPNTSAVVTERIARAATAAAHPGDRVETRAAPFGPPLIVSEAHAAVAAEAVVALVDSLEARYDGIVVASFGDTAIEAVRARVSCPVVGIARSSFLAALAFAERFSIVSFSPAIVPSLLDAAARNGFREKVARVCVVQAPPEDHERDPARLREALADLCREAAPSSGGAIVLGGGPLAGMARTIAPSVPVPVIDGVAAAIGFLHLAHPPVAEA